MVRSEFRWTKKEKEYFWFRSILINWIARGSFSHLSMVVMPPKMGCEVYSIE